MLGEIGEATRFTGRLFREMFRAPFEWSELGRQCFSVGYRSWGLISITAFILGLVLTMQTQPILKDLGAESVLPTMVFLSITVEIGPVITALIFAGRVGSGIGAELGSMRVTEQIDAMEVSGTNPMKFLVSTRVLATTLMVPILVIYADAISLLGSYVGMAAQQPISLNLFVTQAFEELDFNEFLPATIKTFFFGLAIGIISCFKGYYASKGTKGVGQAANAAVVISSLTVFVVDLIAVQLTRIIV